MAVDRATGSKWPSSLQLIGSKGLGGAERWFQRYCEALAERGARAEIAVRAGGALEQALERGGQAPLSYHRLPFRTVWDPVSKAAIDRLVRQTRPQIVHTYMGRATRLTRLAGRRRSRPLHLTRLGGYYKLSSYRHADAWIGNTRQLCDWMVAQGLPAQHVYQIYNFVDRPAQRPEQEMVRLRHALGLATNERLLLCMGRFVTVKGHCYLLEALARLPVETSAGRWRLLMLGDGPLQQRLQEQARGLGIDERILWLGWRLDPAPFLQLADLVVFPSLEREALGNVILEAWAWRRPLVTTAFRGAREIARHGEDAYCVPCADAARLAEGIAQVLGDPALPAALVAGGSRRVEQEFSRDAIMRRYHELYTHLANG
jgi:glycosyltransferase involved in cell wall biosynthesis